MTATAFSRGPSIDCASSHAAPPRRIRTEACVADRSSFIKSATATTPVAKTRTDIMTLLERYGGTGFGYDVVGDDILVHFSVPGAHGSPLRVSYPVNIARVLDRL